MPVPLHAKRKRTRGYNQAQVLAEGISRIRKIGVLNGLAKVKNTPPQTFLDGENRRNNPKGAFAVRRQDAVKGKTLLLVDDVFTTGATMRECSRVLKKGGAKEVRGITLARA